jgi:hypothetical protein
MPNPIEKPVKRYIFYATNDIDETKIVKVFAGILSEIERVCFKIGRFEIDSN